LLALVLRRDRLSGDERGTVGVMNDAALQFGRMHAESIAYSTATAANAPTR
jgi:hypothetical protein